MIEVSAQGTVTTSGWSSPSLKMRRVRADGVVEFDFVAESPKGLSAQVLTPIGAKATFQQPANFKGVRVYSATNNNKDALLE